MLCVACATMLVAAPAHADGTQLDVGVQLSHDQRVSVTGTLKDSGGQPIGSAPVTAKIADTELGSATTAGDGRFSMDFTLPEELRSGNQRLVIGYAGAGANGPAESGVVLALGEDEAERSAADGSQLSVQADSTNPRNGDLIELSGTLATPDGEALANASIEVVDPYGEVTDSFTITDADGHFTTYYEVPADQEEPLDLTIRFPGADSYPNAEATVALDVDYASGSASTLPPAGSENAPDPADSQADGAERAAAPSEEPTVQAMSESEQAPDTEATTDSGSGMTPWLVGAGVTLGGSVIVAVVAVLLSSGRRRGARGDEASGALDLFSDADEDAPTDAPRRGAP